MMSGVVSSVVKYLSSMCNTIKSLVPINLANNKIIDSEALILLSYFSLR